MNSLHDTLEDLRGDLMRARHRLAKLLLRHEIRFDGPERNWTQAHLGWLAGVTLAQPASQRALEDYRGAVSALMIRREQLEAEIARAERLVAAATGGAERFEGAMIEDLHVEAARRLLAR